MITNKYALLSILYLNKKITILEVMQILGLKKEEVMSLIKEPTRFKTAI